MSWEIFRFSATCIYFNDKLCTIYEIVFWLAESRMTFFEAWNLVKKWPSKSRSHSLKTLIAYDRSCLVSFFHFVTLGHIMTQDKLPKMMRFLMVCKSCLWRYGMLGQPWHWDSQLWCHARTHSIPPALRFCTEFEPSKGKAFQCLYMMFLVSFYVDIFFYLVSLMLETMRCVMAQQWVEKLLLCVNGPSNFKC